MPRGDRTGPNGMGPMTGRAAGYCAGNDEAGWTTAPGAFGRGFRRAGRMGAGFGRRRGGFGPGRGFAYGPGPRGGYGYAPREDSYEPASPENRRRVLRTELEALEERMEFLRREIDAMDTAKGSGDE